MAQLTKSATAVDDIFVGMDWGGTSHHVCLIDTQGTTLHHQPVRHDIDGLAELDRLVTGHSGAVRVAIERGEGLLVEHLHTLSDLEAYCVSPKISARAPERHRMAATKSDAFDVFVLADTLRHEHTYWRPLSRPSPLLAELRTIS